MVTGIISPGWFKALPLLLKDTEFARQQLDRLELGQELERVPYGSMTYCLPAPATAT